MKNISDENLREIARFSFREALEEYDFEPLRLAIEQRVAITNFVNHPGSLNTKVVIFVPGATDHDPDKVYGIVEINSKSGSCVSVQILNLQKIR